ncbi:hypothetical protein [Staphylococcus equorum]|nr:hypothetical protein [Staphylococcus equorum]
MKAYRKVIEFIIYTVFTAIIVGISTIIFGLMILGIQNIYSLMF